MSDENSEGKAALLAPMGTKQLLSAGLIGLAIGLIVWGLGSIIDQYVLQPLFCQDGECAATAAWALAIGSVGGAGLGLFGLVKLRLLRPLLVVLAAMIALWNLPSFLADLPLWGVVVASALLYAAMYMLLAWLARLRSIYVVLSLFVIVVIATRFIFTS